MSAVLYLLLSGDVVFVGLALVAAGVLAAQRLRRTGGGLVWAGLTLTLASSWPIHPAVYGLLVLAAIGWQLGRGREARTATAARGALLVLAAVLAGAALRTRHASALGLPMDRPVYVVGDSLSAGLAASAAGTWPGLLGQRLGLRVFNLARAGSTLASASAQVASIPPGPATIVIELGGNDVLGGASCDRFAADLEALLRATVAAERQVVMFELPLAPLHTGYGGVQREICARHGVGLLPRRILAGAITSGGHTTDGLHLSAAGHAWMAEQVRALWR